MYTRVNNTKYGYSSSLGVLPPYKSQDDLIGVADDEVKSTVEYICEQLDWYIYNSEPGRFPLCPHEIPGLNLSVEQAVEVIHQINTKFKFIGALHIPNLNSMLFQTDFGSFALKYGSQSGCYFLYFKFDVDRGFIPATDVSYPDQEEEHVQNIIKVLQEYFQEWSINNRKGFVIPEENQIRNDSLLNRPLVQQEAPVENFTGTWSGFFIRKALPAAAVGVMSLCAANKYLG